MHEALASIVNACQDSSEGSLPGNKIEGWRGGAGGAAGVGGHDKRGHETTGEAANTNGREEGGAGRVGRGKGEVSVVSRKEGEVIVERSRACLRVSSSVCRAFPLWKPWAQEGVAVSDDKRMQGYVVFA